jgi:acylphosphatase
MNKRSLHIVCKGRVQGVFFRASTQEKAMDLGLVGWVKNELNGDVIIYAEGPEENLKALEKWCWKGSPKAEVREVQTKWGEKTMGLSGFKIEKTY